MRSEKDGIGLLAKLESLINGALYLDKSDYRSRMPFILLRISEL